MYEFYPEIRWVHILAISLSGLLFAIRGAARLAGASWPMSPPVRYASYSIDTILLTAALMLVTLLHQYPFVQAWLTVKVLLVVVYIVLGTFALKRARTPRARALFYVAALAVFAFVVTIARAHSPLGFLQRFL